MPAKIQLSPEESGLVNNTQWILTKHVIIQKVYDMFGELNELFKKEAEPYHYLFPDNIKYQSGKISQGNNYLLLPYVILDYPSFFWKERVFAIRTLFWWGNFFSVTLHLSGIYKEKFAIDSSSTLSYLQKNNYYLCINEDEWQHHFEKDNYIAARSITVTDFEAIKEKKFLKISKKISLSDWKNADEFLLQTFRQILQLLVISYLADKKDLLPVFPKAGSGL